jgi:hypothetical protein
MVRPMYDPPLPRWREMATVFDVFVMAMWR